MASIKSAENEHTEEAHFRLPRRLQRFRKFASVEFDGEIFMTPQDFLDSLTLDEPRERVFRIVISESQLRQMLALTPPLRKGTHRMFRELGDNGIISYAEYLFMITLLTKSHYSFNIAFLMFDEDDNFQIDKNEFFKIQFLITSAGPSRRPSSAPSAFAAIRSLAFDQDVSGTWSGRGDAFVIQSLFPLPLFLLLCAALIPFSDHLQLDDCAIAATAFESPTVSSASSSLGIGFSRRHNSSNENGQSGFEHLISSNVALIRTKAEQRLKNMSSKNTKDNSSKLAVYRPTMDELTEAMKRRDTTLTIHLFGRRGQNTLSFDEFQNFYHRLQREIIEIEFHEFARGKNRISTVDFARLVLRYSILHKEEHSPYIRRAYERSEYDEEGVTLQQFEQFSMFLNNLEEFSKAVRLYSLADIPVSQSEFIRAVKCSTGFSLDSALVRVIYKIFDANADDKLSYREFIAVMSDRLSRGLKKQRTEQMFWLNSFKECVRNKLSGISNSD